MVHCLSFAILFSVHTVGCISQTAIAPGLFICCEAIFRKEGERIIGSQIIYKLLSCIFLCDCAYNTNRIDNLRYASFRCISDNLYLVKLIAGGCIGQVYDTCICASGCYPA